jgi:uncharacterized spore protein YtfJ
MGAGDFLERFASGQRVYGEPYEKDGVTIIPAFTVRAGGGFGRGPAAEGPDGEASGGGGGVIARPVGAYIVKDGKAEWEPAIDVNRVILGGQILAALALIVFAVTRRAR